MNGGFFSRIILLDLTPTLLRCAVNDIGAAAFRNLSLCANRIRALPSRLVHLRKKTPSARDRIESGLTGRRLPSGRRGRCRRASGQGREGRDP